MHRPGLALGLALDAPLALIAYASAYWLRFPGDRLSTFLPGLWQTTPVVIVSQLVALAALRAYAPMPRTSWLFRVVAGGGLGAAAAMLITGGTVGFQGVSRMAFVADALLFSIAALGWRGIWVLRARARFTRARGATTAGRSCGRDDDARAR